MRDLANPSRVAAGAQKEPTASLVRARGACLAVVDGAPALQLCDAIAELALLRLDESVDILHEALLTRAVLASGETGCPLGSLTTSPLACRR